MIMTTIDLEKNDKSEETDEQIGNSTVSELELSVIRMLTGKVLDRVGDILWEWRLGLSSEKTLTLKVKEEKALELRYQERYERLKREFGVEEEVLDINNAIVERNPTTWKEAMRSRNHSH